uniref:Uncharacterized protein n=1 Tax=Romanomermis culicivorax TaxID=13658 RepID=A0A915HTS1_ROMCU
MSDGESENDDKDGDVGGDSGSEIGLSPRRKRLKRSARLEKEQWIKDRNQALFDYYEFSYYSSSVNYFYSIMLFVDIFLVRTTFQASLLLFDLAWKISKDNPDLLWCATVGLTSQLIEGQINLSKYTLDSADVQQHMSRHNHMLKSEADFSVDCTKMSFEKE